MKMSHFVMYLTLIVLNCLSPGPGSVIIISGQGQKTSTKVLEKVMMGSVPQWRVENVLQ